MRNRWTVERDPVIGWVAILRGEWRTELLRWGAETGVYRAEAGAIGVGRQLPPGSSTIAYVDAAGAVVEGEVSDLGEIPNAASRRRRPPLDFFVWSEPGSDAVELRVRSCSTVWLPWCSARHEDGAHSDDLADNRVLARRHTPRLNDFLGRLHRIAEAMTVMEDSWPLLTFQLDDHGVRLDAENPYARSFWEPFDAPGERDLAGALRRTLRRLALDPPPAPYRAVIGADTDGVRERAEVLEELRRADLTQAELAGIVKVSVRTGWVSHHFDPAEVIR